MNPYFVNLPATHEENEIFLNLGAFTVIINDEQEKELRLLAHPDDEEYVSFIGKQREQLLIKLKNLSFGH